MKKIKLIDFWISVALIITFLAISLITQDGTFIIGYFVVGGWQVISMVVHMYGNWFNEKKGKRRVYHWITGISLVSMPLGSFYILVFTAPFMAIYYTWICYDEVFVKMQQRPLYQLK